MARVWLAWDEQLSREVAIKEVVPPSGLTAGEQKELGRRMLLEARATARLSHPNVVRMYDVVHTEEHPWLVMEHVPSRSLHQVIEAEGLLAPTLVAEIGLGVLAALRAAHAVGVLHRDVKPSNVLLADDGRVVLTDFGLAVVIGDASITRAGLILGSPAYIAPERALDAGVGPASDLWSLGATLYAALEGKSPYARTTTMATLAALVTEPAPPAPHAGPLRQVLAGLLRKDPAIRIDADEAEQMLRDAAGPHAGTGRIRLPAPSRPVNLDESATQPVAALVAAQLLAESVTTVLKPAGAPADDSATGVIGRTRSAAPRDGTPLWRRFWGIPAAVVVALVLGGAGWAAGLAFGSTVTNRDVAFPLPVPTGVTLPDGWQTYRDPAGFTLAAPTSWTRSRDGATLSFRSDSRLLGITRIEQLGWNPLQELTNQEQAAGSRHPGYRLINLAPLAYWPYWVSGAEWEYSYDLDGVRTHVISRSFRSSERQAYVLSWSTAEAEWRSNTTYFDLVSRTFQPTN